ncbi:carbohydrate ABC transporter permease [Faecalimonas umbilicata]|uniref:carbohydrate ABC transporter permease n=1 Tax=Faecalimonas umbilicata TaxID=1912855 RepID=UPI0022E88A4E|nr:sugar ABC transporter permease [Faecalimonas umbilicata]
MKRRWKIRNPQFRAFLYLLPALSVIAVFQFYPVLKSFFMGFYTKFDYLTDTVEAVGLDNFLYVLKDQEFVLAMKNTAVFAVISVPLGIITALVFALILNSNIRFQKFFRSAYFLPFVTSTTAVAVVWRWMLNKDYGMVNALLSVLGMPKVAWLTDAQMTIPILIVLSVWKGLGYKIIILLAALQGVDERYVKAGRMDGAGSFRRICYIILPILRPTILFLSVTSLIGAFKIFDEVYIMYGQKPGPLQSGLTIVYYIFDKFYRHWEFTTASAAAFLLFLVILFFTLLQFLFSSERRKS